MSKYSMITTVEQDGPYSGEEVGNVLVGAPNNYFTIFLRNHTLAVRVVEKLKTLTDKDIEAWLDECMDVQSIKHWLNSGEQLPRASCFMCGKPGDDNTLSWCKTCAGDICGGCDCAHNTWGA